MYTPSTTYQNHNGNGETVGKTHDGYDPDYAKQRNAVLEGESSAYACATSRRDGVSASGQTSAGVRGCPVKVPFKMLFLR